MKTILQVEDDPNDIFLLQRAMKKVGMTTSIQVAHDGQEAIDYLQGAGEFADREKFPFPSLVLLDCKLPYVMGLEVLRWIRKQPWPALPVVMLTASGEDADIVTAYRLGVNAFLTKPSEASKFQDMVTAISGFWLTHNTLPQATYTERQAAPLQSSTIDPGARTPRVNGKGREVRPIEPKQSDEESNRSVTDVRRSSCEQDELSCADGTLGSGPHH